MVNKEKICPKINKICLLANQLLISPFVDLSFPIYFVPAVILGIMIFCTEGRRIEKKQKTSNVLPTKEKTVAKQWHFSFSFTNVNGESFPTPKVKIRVVKY